MTVSGPVDVDSGEVLLRGLDHPRVHLVDLHPADVVQWDSANSQAQPAQPEEIEAFARLASLVVTDPGHSYTLTGPLLQSDNTYVLEVRQFTTA